MKKTSVCFISHHAYALFDQSTTKYFGGAEVQLYQLAIQLAKLTNYRVSFQVGDFGQAAQQKFGKINVFKSYFKVAWLPQILLRPLYIIQFFHSLLAINADVYVQRAAGFETGLVALFCRLFSRKFIYMVAHDIDVNGDYRKQNQILGRIYIYGLTHAHLIITQHLAQSEMLQKNYQLPSVILRSGYPIVPRAKAHKKNILWVARLDSWKQPEIFLKLVKALPQYHFVMVAPTSGDSNYANVIYRQAATLTNLKVIRHVPFSQINQYFQEAKLFINTSRFEGFPNTYIQAAINQTPVISLLVNPDNILTEHKFGFSAQGSFTRLKAQTRKVMENHQLWETLSSNSYHYAHTHHDLTQIATKLDQLISQVVQS